MGSLLLPMWVSLPTKQSETTLRVSLFLDLSSTFILAVIRCLVNF